MSSKITINDIIEIIEDMAPPYLAEPYDNIGLLAGDRTAIIKGIYITLDLTETAICNALSNGSNLIITHHPQFFNKINRLTTDTIEGQLIMKCIKNDIAIYTAHTNLDKCKDGTDDILANKLDLINIQPLTTKTENPYMKLVVYTPISHIKIVKSTLSDLETGWIGNYKDCSFITSGKGYYTPLAGSKPFLGDIGYEHEESECKIETIIQKEKLSYIINALRKVHPYEEMAWDAYQLMNNKELPLFGRMGTLKETMTTNDFCMHVAEKLDIKAVELIGDKSKSIKKVVTVAGAGGEFLYDAQKKCADIFVTGEAKHHEKVLAYNMGISMILTGHHVIENPVIKYLANSLQKHLFELKWNIRIHFGTMDFVSDIIFM